jgi:hypothetical protein
MKGIPDYSKLRDFISRECKCEPLMSNCPTCSCTTIARHGYLILSHARPDCGCACHTFFTEMNRFLASQGWETWQ